MFFSHPPKKEEGDLCERNSSGVDIRTLYFYETTAWNHFILYMHISLGGVFNISENFSLDGIFNICEKLWIILCNSIKCL